MAGMYRRSMMIYSSPQAKFKGTKMVNKNLDAAVNSHDINLNINL